MSESTVTNTSAPAQQEPVAWRGTCKSMPQPDWTYETERGYLVEFGCDHIEPLYTHPSADLRAELDHWKQRVALGYDDQRKLEAERDELRAELAEAKRDFDALYERAHMLEKELDKHKRLLREEMLDNHKLEAERDSLRALLQRAREQLVMSDCPALKQEIDAALKGTP